MALDANGGSAHCLGATGGLGDSGGDDSTRRRFGWAVDATGGSGCSLGATGGRGDSGDESESLTSKNRIMPGGGGLLRDDLVCAVDGPAAS
jgi:hypothetical protein